MVDHVMHASSPTEVPEAPPVFEFEAIRHVHLELTTRCNALCPMCRRTEFGGVARGLAIRDLSIEEIRTIFTPDFLRQLRQVDLCGVHGDPVAARSFDAAVEWFAAANAALAIEVYTNGALRPPQWWAELARRIAAIRVVFAIDGLEDTYAFYRRGASFDKVVENARAFIDAGGRAQWDFLVFRHNEHQLDEAKRRASELGFSSFVPKFSGRFYRGYYENDAKFKEEEKWNRFPVHDADREIVGYLEPPTNPAFVNPVFAQMAKYVARDGSLGPYWDKTKICCSVLANHSIFVAADGAIFPCCWTYSASLNQAVYGINGPFDDQMETLLRRCGGRATIDARRRSLRDICRSELFRQVASSWGRRGLADGKLKICARMCGSGFNQYRSQFMEGQSVPGQPQPPTATVRLPADANNVARRDESKLAGPPVPTGDPMTTEACECARK
jgi:MoaA/NifB/PqqE/SkfB family radical SAM enzyme